MHVLDLVIVRWSDNTRDVLNFIINYMPESVDDSPAPHIPRVTPDASYRRRHYGFKQRELICLGHSFGGTTMYGCFINALLSVY